MINELGMYKINVKKMRFNNKSNTKQTFEITSTFDYSIRFEAQTFELQL